jgi:hypothetical protein
MIKRFKQNNLGAYRAIIVGAVPGVITLWYGVFLCWDWHIQNATGAGHLESETISLCLGILIYWLCAIAGVWIYQGFTENK